MDIAALAPKVEVTVYPWREPKDLLAKTVNQVRDFLRAHQPATAARLSGRVPVGYRGRKVSEIG
jgi:hypothetical protein